MSKVIVVTSGKGGVGKTTSTASLGVALAQGGRRVCVVDFDVGLRNLDLVMGAERRVVFDFINVAQGDAKLAQALIRDKRIDTLHLLAASQTRDKDALTTDGVERVIGELRETFDYVLCDSPAGIERGALLAMRHADQAIVVANPEVSSVRDSDRIIGLLDSKTLRAERGEQMDKHLLLTRFDPVRSNSGEMLSIDDVLEILSIPLLGRHPGEQRDFARLEHRRSGDDQRLRRPGWTSLSRSGPTSRRRNDGASRDPGRKEDLLHAPVRPEGSMNLFGFLKARGSAPVARERLQILLAHERVALGPRDLVAILRDELLATIARHIEFDPEKLSVKMERSDSVSTLEIDVEIPCEKFVSRTQASAA